MTKEEINTALEELNKQEMSKDVMIKGKPLLESYQAAVAQSIQSQKEKFVTDGGLPEDFKLEREEHDVRFDELWAQFSKLKKEFKEKLANAENDNLSVKEALLAKFTQVNLLNTQGMQIPLSELVTIQKKQRGHNILSKNLYPLVDVVGETDGVSQIYALLDIRKLIQHHLANEYEIDKVGLLDLELKDKKSNELFHLHWDGEQKVSMDTVTDLSMALGVAIVVIFFMMVVYYKSFSLATSIISASFISIIGVIYMHLFYDMFTPTQFYMTGTSLIGFIALIGINSRNSLLIIDFAKQLIEEHHLDVDRAIAVSVNTRAKPILLTVLAIIFASTLLTFDPVFGGLGVALIGGTLAAYLVSLFIVPIFIQKALHGQYYKEGNKDEK